MRCLERSQTDRMLALALTAQLRFAAPVDPPGRRKGIDGTWTGPVWFQAIFEGRVTVENVKSYRAIHPVLAEQTRIALVCRSIDPDETICTARKVGLSIARRDHGPRF